MGTASWRDKGGRIGQKKVEVEIGKRENSELSCVCVCGMDMDMDVECGCNVCLEWYHTKVKYWVLVRYFLLS